MITELVVPLLASLALAFLAESMTEYVFAWAFDLAAEKWPLVKAIEPLRYVALMVGICLAFAYQLDLLLVAFPTMPPSVAGIGIFLTGMAIGRGANYVHDMWSRYLKPEHPSA